MPRPMKAYASFDEFLADQTPSNALVIRRIRRLVKQQGLDLHETVKWGNGCWVATAGPVAYVHCEPEHVQFGFFAGSSLPDPDRVLEGNGKYVRFVRLRRVDDVKPAVLAGLLRSAVNR